MVIVEREKRFAIAERIELAPGELHEICIYYSRLADQVTESFSANLAARGIAPAAVVPQRYGDPGAQCLIRPRLTDPEWPRA